MKTGLRIQVGKILFSPDDDPGGGTAVLDPPKGEARPDPLLGAPAKNGEKPPAEIDPAKLPADELKPSTVPEKYELKLPENSTLDESVTERIGTIARDLGLSNESAQKTLDFLNTEVASREAAVLESHQPGGAEWSARVKEWNASALKDPDIGAGNADTLKANVAIAEKAATEFFGAEVRQFLFDTGYASHPAIVGALVKIGKAMSEGRVLPVGEPPAKDKKSPAQLLYGATAPKTE